MPTLDRPGASLHYDTYGTGPLFVLIPGGNGSGDLYQPLAGAMSSRYTVVTYDRRGFSRSVLQGEQDYDVRLQTDADDVQALIKHLSPNGKATVYGSSSGAIVALRLLLSHPESIDVLIPHEPPAIDVLPDKEEWVAWNYDIYNIFKTQGAQVAFEKFMKGVLGGAELAMSLQRMAAMKDKPVDPNSAVVKNQQYWFEHELRQYPPAALDLNELAKYKDKLILAVGRDSHNLFPCRPNKVLSEKLGLPLVEVPGAHTGFFYAADEFAKVLLEALDKHAK